MVDPINYRMISLLRLCLGGKRASHHDSVAISMQSFVSALFVIVSQRSDGHGTFDAFKIDPTCVWIHRDSVHLDLQIGSTFIKGSVC